MRKHNPENELAKREYLAWLRNADGRTDATLDITTGTRDAAVASLRLKHLDLSARTLFQDAREVKTKRAKTITSALFPVGEPFEEIIRAWVEELTRDHQFGPDDPLFPILVKRIRSASSLKKNASAVPSR
jgi:hypothetical protein